MRWNKINEKQAEKILEDYGKGKSINKIAKELKVDRTTIYYHLGKQEIKLTKKFNNNPLKEISPANEKCLICGALAKYFAFKNWFCFLCMDSGEHLRIKNL